MTTLDVESVALLVARNGSLPLGGSEAVAEAGGRAIVVGTGVMAAAAELRGACATWVCETGPALRATALAPGLAVALRDVALVLLPASPDGRDLAPRLAAAMDRPLLAAAVRVRLLGRTVSAELHRLDGRLALDVEAPAPVVATLVPASRAPLPDGPAPTPERLRLPQTPAHDAQVLEVLEPDPATMDLSEATRVLGGGAGLVRSDEDDATARATFDLLAAVAGRLGASAGATRVATDAGWIGHDRQIGTTGVTVDPDLYVALGVSGASQHVGGLGAPRHVVSINTDPSCPLTAMADLGIVADARAVLDALADRLGVPRGPHG